MKIDKEISEYLISKDLVPISQEGYKIQIFVGKGISVMIEK